MIGFDCIKCCSIHAQTSWEMLSSSRSPDVLCAGSAPAAGRTEPGSQEEQAGSGWGDADTHPGSLRPRCAKPCDNRASGLLGGQLPAEKGPRAARSIDTQPSICWLKSNRLANPSTSVSTALYGFRWK